MADNLQINVNSSQRTPVVMEEKKLVLKILSSVAGAKGDSIYTLAVKHGYTGTEEEFVETYMRSVVDNVYDISASHLVEGQPSEYTNLAAALGVDGANIPSDLQLGGMSVKFIESTGHTYVQYRLMKNQFSTNESDWQGVDSEPTAGSDNLVKSGGVFQNTTLLKGITIHGNATKGYLDNMIDGQSIVLSEYPYFIKRGTIITFESNITSFSKLHIGFGYNQLYGKWFTIDNEKVIVYYESSAISSAISSFGFEHNLTLQDFIKVEILIDNDDVCYINIRTLGGAVSKDIAGWSFETHYGCKDVFALSEQSVLYNCDLTADNINFDKKVWTIGDSYAAAYYNRWPYHVMKKGYDQFLWDALGGANSAQMYQELEKMLQHGSPQYLLWGLGMNDTDEVFTQYFDAVKELCDSKGITLIAMTVPTVPSRDKETITQYIRNSGVRYVDVYKAVGADSSGNWYSGYLDPDNVHPSSLGSQSIAEQILCDFPEFGTLCYSERQENKNNYIEVNSVSGKINESISVLSNTYTKLKNNFNVNNGNTFIINLNSDKTITRLVVAANSQDDVSTRLIDSYTAFTSKSFTITPQVNVTSMYIYVTTSDNSIANIDVEILANEAYDIYKLKQDTASLPTIASKTDRLFQEVDGIEVSVAEAANTNRLLIDNVKIKSGETFTFKFTGTAETGTRLILRANVSDYSHNIQDYIVIGTEYAKTAAYDIEKFYLYHDKQVDLEFKVMFSTKKDIANLKDRASALETRTSNIEYNTYDKITAKSINLCDPNAVTPNYGIKADGTVVTWASRQMSDYIKAVPEGLISNGNIGTMFAHAVYNKSFERIRLFTTNQYVYQEGDAYVRFGFASVQTIKIINIGTELLAYTTYNPIEGYISTSETTENETVVLNQGSNNIVLSAPLSHILKGNFTSGYIFGTETSPGMRIIDNVLYLHKNVELGSATNVYYRIFYSGGSSIEFAFDYDKTDLFISGNALHGTIVGISVRVANNVEGLNLTLYTGREALTCSKDSENTPKSYNLLDVTKAKPGDYVRMNYYDVSNNQISLETTSNETYRRCMFPIDGIEEGKKYYIRATIDYFEGDGRAFYFRFVKSDGTSYGGFDINEAGLVPGYSYTDKDAFTIAQANTVGVVIFITANVSSYSKLILSKLMVAESKVVLPYVPFSIFSAKQDKVELNETINIKTRPIHATFHKRQPRVTFIDDDGNKEFYTYMVPIMRTYGIPMCSAYECDVHPTMRENTAAYMTLEECKEVEALGGEILVHGGTALTNLTIEEAEKNVLKSKNALETLGFKHTNIYVYPNGASNEDVRQMIEQHFDCAFNTASPYNDVTRVNDKCIPHYFIHRSSAGGYYDTQSPLYGNYEPHTIEYFQALVEDCISRSGWLVFMTHAWMMPENSSYRNDPNHPERAYPGLDEFGLIEDIIKYIQSRSNTGIKIVTASEGFEMFRNAIQAGDYLSYWNDTSLHTSKGIAINQLGQFDMPIDNNIIS